MHRFLLLLCTQSLLTKSIYASTLSSPLKREGNCVTSNAQPIFQNHTTLDETYTDKALLELNGPNVTVICKTCRIKGSTSASLRADSTSQLGEDVDAAVADATSVFADIATWLSIVDPVSADLSPPSIDFNTDIPVANGAILELNVENMEIEADLDTQLPGGSTYSIPIISSPPVFGIKVGKTRLGAVLSVHLILTADSDVTLRHGFKVKLGGPARLQVPLFAEAPSCNDVHSATFDALPVTVTSASGTKLDAIVRLSFDVGFELSTDIIPIDKGFQDVGTGLIAGAFLDIADVVLDLNELTDGDDCSIQALQEYTFAVGAEAGAYVAVGDTTYGPTPETRIPLFHTTLSPSCVSSAGSGTVTAPTSGTHQSHAGTSTIGSQVPAPTTSNVDGAASTTQAITASPSTTYPGQTYADPPIYPTSSAINSSGLTGVGSTGAWTPSVTTSLVVTVPTGAGMKTISDASFPLLGAALLILSMLILS